MGQMQARPASGMYTVKQVTELTLRTAALTLMAVNLGIYWNVMNNKRSLVSRMIFAFLLTYTLGLIFQCIPRFTGDKSFTSTVFTIHLGVGFFNLSSELFLWTLYLRFKLIIPFQKKLRWFTLAILTTSSLVVFCNYCAWATFTTRGDWDSRVQTSKFYSAWSIVQAAINMYLSGYFVFQYYVPLINQSSNGSATTAVNMWLSGLIYLGFEALLHCGLQILYYAWKDHYAEAAAVCSSIRYMLFLMFIYKIREANHSRVSYGNNGKGVSTAQGATTGGVGTAANMGSMLKATV
ncbi:hypothetical protein HDU85_005214 [Gaertneriomyces sp. JEL0708]|nr:hypothetical protein HDU85_005214 [Gaertneriomyces sp. JEL0708]